MHSSGNATPGVNAGTCVIQMLWLEVTAGNVKLFSDAVN